MRQVFFDLWPGTQYAPKPPLADMFVRIIKNTFADVMGEMPIHRSVHTGSIENGGGIREGSGNQSLRLRVIIISLDSPRVPINGTLRKKEQ